jgi:hypothetical protein
MATSLIFSVEKDPASRGVGAFLTIERHSTLIFSIRRVSEIQTPSSDAKIVTGSPRSLARRSRALFYL